MPEQKAIRIERFACRQCRYQFDAPLKNNNPWWRNRPRCPECRSMATFHCPMGDRGRLVLKAIDAYRKDGDSGKFHQSIRKARVAKGLDAHPDTWRKRPSAS